MKRKLGIGLHSVIVMKREGKDEEDEDNYHDVFKKFCSSSTIHGTYFWGENRTYIGKFVWICIVLMGTETTFKCDRSLNLLLLSIFWSTKMESILESELKTTWLYLTVKLRIEYSILYCVPLLL